MTQMSCYCIEMRTGIMMWDGWQFDDADDAAAGSVAGFEH